MVLRSETITVYLLSRFTHLVTGPSTLRSKVCIVGAQMREEGHGAAGGRVARRRVTLEQRTRRWSCWGCALRLVVAAAVVMLEPEDRSSELGLHDVRCDSCEGPGLLAPPRSNLPASPPSLARSSLPPSLPPLSLITLFLCWCVAHLQQEDLNPHRVQRLKEK